MKTQKLLFIIITLCFSHFGKELFAAIECSGQNGIFEKIGVHRAIGTPGVFKNTKYKGVFVLYNGNRIYIEARDSQRIRDGKDAEGSPDKSNFTISYSRYVGDYGGGDSGMAHKQFKPANRKPPMLLVRTYGGEKNKTEKYVFAAERLPQDEFERHGFTPAPDYIVEASISSERTPSGRWKSKSGVLTIYLIKPGTNKREAVATLDGEGILESIQQGFDLRR